MSRLIYFPAKKRMVSSRVVIAHAAIHSAILSVSLHVCPTDAVIVLRTEFVTEQSTLHGGRGSPVF